MVSNSVTFYALIIVGCCCWRLHISDEHTVPYFPIHIWLGRWVRLVLGREPELCVTVQESSWSDRCFPFECQSLLFLCPEYYAPDKLLYGVFTAQQYCRCVVVSLLNCMKSFSFLPLYFFCQWHLSCLIHQTAWLSSSTSHPLHCCYYAAHSLVTVHLFL